VAAGVPTIWMAVLPELKDRDVSSLRVVPCGGSAVPRALSEAYREQIGLPVFQAWGMTETSPVASACQLRSTHLGLSEEEKADVRTTVGRVLFGVDFRVVEPGTTVEVPRDGTTSGELQVRGPWVAASYYRHDDQGESFSDDGWLRTGDVATVDADGYLRLVDRTKDLVKSGGEWISSVELENELMAHPKVAEAAVIGVASEKWGERPIACVVPKPGETVDKDELLAFLGDRVAKWQLPDDIVEIDEPEPEADESSDKKPKDQEEA